MGARSEGMSPPKLAGIIFPMLDFGRNSVPPRTFDVAEATFGRWRQRYRSSKSEPCEATSGRCCLPPPPRASGHFCPTPLIDTQRSFARAPPPTYTRNPVARAPVDLTECGGARSCPLLLREPIAMRTAIPKAAHGGARWRVTRGGPRRPGRRPRQPRTSGGAGELREAWRKQMRPLTRHECGESQRRRPTCHRGAAAKSLA